MSRFASERQPSGKITRRALLVDGLAAVGIGTAGAILRDYLRERSRKARVFIAKAASYNADLVSPSRTGCAVWASVPTRSRQADPAQAEFRRDHARHNPHLHAAGSDLCGGRGVSQARSGDRPDRRRAPATAGTRHGSSKKPGMAEALGRAQDAVRRSQQRRPGRASPTPAGRNGLATLTLPAAVDQVDWIVSMPKMKTHHWVGVTLSMKNLFGLMPGIVYGWPKNVFHWAGTRAVGPGHQRRRSSRTWPSSTASSAWKATARSWARRNPPG